jgi:hypothetical protein
MIFTGAPLVEATRGNRRFTAPLTAITAAVALFRFKIGLISGAL